MTKTQKTILILQILAGYLSLLVISFVHSLTALSIKVAVWVMAKTSILKPKLLGGINGTRAKLTGH